MGKERFVNKRKGKRREKRLKIHPLFLLLGGYYCFTKQLPSFLIATLVALQHECAHAYVAERLGYRLNCVVLMPYGAVIEGDLHGIGFLDELKVLLAGPLCNLLTAFAFVALWWLCPTAYPYTDAAARASLSVALVNLLPAYPLDGGRVATLFLRRALGDKKGQKVGRISSVVLSSLLALSFFVFLFSGRVKIELLAFSLFVLFGALGKKTYYEPIDFSYKNALKRGAEIKRVALLEGTAVRQAVKYIERGKYLIVDLYDENEKKKGELTQTELAEIFYKKGLTAPLFVNGGEKRE